MQRTPFYLLAVISVGVSGLAIYQHGTIQDQSAKISALEQTVSKSNTFVFEVQKGVEKLSHENAALAEESKVLREKLAAVPTPEPVVVEVAPTPQTAPEKKPPFAGMMDKIMKDPKMAEAMAAQQMAMMKPMYADLVKQLKLTPEETEKFFELMAARNARFMGSGMKMLNGDKKGAIEDAGKRDDELKAFLGPRFPQYENYEKTIGDRMQLSQITGQMAARQAPLRPDQSTTLLQIMQQEKLNTAKFRTASTTPNDATFDPRMMSDTINAQEERNARILARSKNLLTPQQLTALGEQQKQSLEMQKLGMEMAKKMMAEPAK